MIPHAMTGKQADHYFSKKQSSPAREKTITIRLSQDTFELTSADGIFSKDKIDFGTRLLIESTRVADAMRVLDLGCGYGVVGIALLRRHPRLRVVMSDVNERAVEVAGKNVERCGLSKGDIIVRASDLFEGIPETFDAILLNPPYAAGRSVCQAMITEAGAHLEKGGFLELVARHQKGGAMLEKKMREVFGNVETISKRGGFRVYRSLKD
jgi:16S rRNA (guanine1207-N2)-methyltransferase